MTAEHIAHVKPREGKRETHALEEHLLEVADLAKKFAAPLVGTVNLLSTHSACLQWLHRQ